jgi:predicted phosphoadenosine phosphosulfate sulfurtransferase
MKQTIIFSVFKSELNSLENNLNMKKAKKLLEYYNIDFKEVIGSYQGTQESSLMVDLKHLNVIKSMADRYNQDSIMILDNDLNSMLLFQNNDTMSLGKFRHIESILDRDAWTLIDGLYYIAE